MSKFDSEAFYERLYEFAKNCQDLTKKLSRTNYNLIYSDQLIRSSGSVGANYIEALEALSTKDFIHRLRICRKEARESVHWLRLTTDTNENLSEVTDQVKRLIQEGQEIKRILSASIITSENRIK